MKLVDFSLYFGNRFEKKRREKKKEKPILNFHPVGGGRRPFCKALISKSTLLSVAGWETFTIPTNKLHRRACSPSPPPPLLSSYFTYHKTDILSSVSRGTYLFIPDGNVDTYSVNQKRQEKQEIQEILFFLHWANLRAVSGLCCAGIDNTDATLFTI